MKKLLVVILTLSLMLALPAVAEETASGYGVYVGGVEVTPDNKDDVLGDGKVAYDPDLNALFLRGALIAAAGVVPDADALAAIYSEGDLSVRVGDKCVIGFFGDSRSNAAWYGIRCGGKLTVRGASAEESTLMIAVCGADGTVQASDACGIYSAGDMEVATCLIQSGCETAASGFEASTQHGVLCTGLLKIQGALLAGYTSEQTLASGTVGVEIRALDYERAAIIGMSGNSGFEFGGAMTPDEYSNLAYQQMFSPLHVVSGDNYDGSGTTMDQLNNFVSGNHTAKYVAIQPMS